MFHKAFTQRLSLKEYIAYLIPSIISMIFLSFYTTIDGFFISKYVDSNGLAAINIVIPLTCIFFGISIMLATGGGALIGIRQGQGRIDRANRLFSSLFVLLWIFIILLTAFSIIFLEKILLFSGSNDVLMPYAKVYGFWTAVTIPAMMCKLFLEHMARVDGHSKVSMAMSVLGLLSNVVLNSLFVISLDMGIAGAGLGTCISMYISAFIGLLHFTVGNHNLTFKKPAFLGKELLHSCGNGLSELMTELSTGVTTLLFNISLLAIAGERGVATISLLGYYYYFFTSFYFGITVASQPIISYSYGAGNEKKLKETTLYATALTSILALTITSMCIVFASPLISFFSDDPRILEMGVPALKLFALTFLLSGVNIFASGYFTAMGKGLPSAIISFLRSFICIILYLQILPKFLGITGIWLTNSMAELTTLFVVIILCIVFRKKLFKPYS